MRKLTSPIDRLRSLAALVVFGGGVVGALATPSFAAEGDVDEIEPSLVVLEVFYDGQDFTKTPDYAKGVQDRIAKLGGFALLSRPDAQRVVAKRFPPSEQAKVADNADDIRKRVKQAEDVFFRDGPKAALPQLRQLNAELQKMADSLSLSDEFKREYISSQMLLGLVYLRSEQKTKATQVMEDLVRQVGKDASINIDSYHPDSVALYEKVVKDLKNSNGGKLAVRTSPPGADVFINGLKQSRKTPATYEGLYPGKLKLVVQKDGLSSRVRTITITEGGETDIQIDLKFEAALAFDSERFGVSFPDVESRKRNLPAFASALGRLLDVDYVAVVGLEPDGEAAALGGQLIHVETEKPVRGTAMKTRSNVISKRRVIQMARFLVYGDAPEVAYKPWYDNTLGWVLTGAGVAGGVVGTIFYLDFLDNKDIAECDPTVAGASCLPEAERFDAKDTAETSRTIAYAGWGLGAAGIVGGILSFALMQEEDLDADVRPRIPGSPTMTELTPSVLPGGGFGVSSTFTF